MLGYITFPEVDGATRAALRGDFVWECQSDVVLASLNQTCRFYDWQPAYGEPGAWLLSVAAKMLGGQAFPNPPPEREPGIIH